MTPIFKDISTVFSIAPFELFETKPSLYPGTFRIPACFNQNEPIRLLVKPSTHIMIIGGTRRPIHVETPSHTIAKSIVDDCINAQLYSGPGCGPGLVWLPGDISVEKLKIEYKELYTAMIAQQRKWFVARCKQTDDEWAKHHTHRVASDIDRFAAKSLGLNPEWMAADDIYAYVKCPACGTMNDKENALCSNCSCVFDPEKVKKFTFANKG